jgi:hypothetical protein
MCNVFGWPVGSGMLFLIGLVVGLILTMIIAFATRR